MQRLLGSLVLLVLTIVAGRAWADCPTGSTPCGTQYCTPSGKVCCADAGHPELSCEGGYICQMNGTCLKEGSCTNGGQQTIADCGGDTCGCSAPCKDGKDCSSGCCTGAGFCAPACVCNSGGRLYLDCSMKGASTTGKSSGCAAVPGAPTSSTAFFAVAVAALGLALLRRRARV